MLPAHGESWGHGAGTDGHHLWGAGDQQPAGQPPGDLHPDPHAQPDWGSDYQAASRTGTSTSAANRVGTTTLDTLGRVVSTQFGGLAPGAYTYDSRGRLASATAGSGGDARTATFAYDSLGYLQTLVDPIGRSSTYSYDPAGRLTTSVLPGNRTITFAYDASGNLTALTPPGRSAHLFTYSPVDLLTSYTAPALGGPATVTTYTYNLDRQLTRQTRPDGSTINLAYDTGGRLATAMIARGVYTFTYHPTTGNLANVLAPGGQQLTYGYDGELPTSTTWAGPVGGSVGRTYDNDFRVVTHRVNGGSQIAFTYDPDNLLTGAGALTLTRDPQHGLLTGTTLGTISDTWAYNAFAEPTSYSATASNNPQALFNQQFTYDALGRITQKTESFGGPNDGFAYTYDAAGRLANVTRNGAAVASYTYDSNGNRLTRTTPQGTTTGTYDAQDRLTASGTATYAYTPNGELLSKTDGGQTTTYQYDALGNLVQVGIPNATTITYLIDGQNRRVGRRIGGVQKGWLYDDQLRIVAELDDEDQLASRFAYASKTKVPDYLIQGSVTYRIISDHLGSPRLAVNTATGAIAQRLDYDEFGVVTQDTAPGFQPFGFAGGLYDPTTKLVRFGARDYDPTTGRWTSKDPILFAGGFTNLYSYVGNDPINFVDPSGLKGGGKITDAIKDPLLNREINTIQDAGARERAGQIKDIVDFVTDIPGKIGDFFINRTLDEAGKPQDYSKIPGVPKALDQELNKKLPKTALACKKKAKETKENINKAVNKVADQSPLKPMEDSWVRWQQDTNRQIQQWQDNLGRGIRGY